MGSYNIQLKYNHGNGNEIVELKLLDRIKFVGKKSPSGGIVVRKKLETLDVIGTRTKDYVQTLSFLGFGNDVDVFENYNIEELKKFVSANPKDFNACLALFHRVLWQPNVDEAEFILKQCNPSYSKEWAMFYNNYGVLEFERREFEKGLSYLSKSLNYAPCNIFPNRNIYEYYIFKKDSKSATNFIRNLVKSCTENQEYWVNELHTRLPKSDNIEEDISIFTNVSDKDPSNGNYYYYLGRCYELQGQPLTAIKNYLQAIEHETKFKTNALINMSNNYRLVNNYDKAEYYAKETIKINPKFLLGHYHLAYSYFMRNRYTEAIYEYEQTLNIDPKFFAAYKELGDLYTIIGEKKKAVENFEMARMYWPQN